jgi:hypothetical protein
MMMQNAQPPLRSNDLFDSADHSARLVAETLRNNAINDGG